MRALSLPTQSAGFLYPQEITLLLFSVKVWVDPKTIVRPEGLCPYDPIGNQTFDLPAYNAVIEPATAYPRSHRKWGRKDCVPMIPSGIKPATFRHVTQWSNQPPRTPEAIERRFLYNTKISRRVLVPLLQRIPVAGLGRERAVIRHSNVAFDEDPLPCMGIRTAVKGSMLKRLITGLMTNDRFLEYCPQGLATVVVVQLMGQIQDATCQQWQVLSDEVTSIHTPKDLNHGLLTGVSWVDGVQPPTQLNGSWPTDHFHYDKMYVASSFMGT
jgi:hypothetical protein